MRLGRCLCGSVRYELDGEPLVVAHCFCEDCQRVSGAGHSTGAMYPVERARVIGIVAEFDLETEESTVTRTFCPRCGSPLHGRNSRMPGVLTFTAGTLEHPGSVVPQVGIFTRSKQHWDGLATDVALFETQPSWKPGDAV
ncbi:MAG: hypothetical protein JWN48_4329 [Myxococcaceae bacterium]|nr:hypothetical protein [Myxococcaceae bacterium]